MAHRRLLHRVPSSKPRAGPKQRALPTARSLPEGARRWRSKIGSFVPNGVVHSGKEAMERNSACFFFRDAAVILLTAAPQQLQHQGGLGRRKGGRFHRGVKERARKRRESHHDEVVRWVTSLCSASEYSSSLIHPLFYFSSALPGRERERETGWCRQAMASALAA